MNVCSYNDLTGCKASVMGPQCPPSNGIWSLFKLLLEVLNCSVLMIVGVRHRWPDDWHHSVNDYASAFFSVSS